MCKELNLDFDKDGLFARSGKLNNQLLNKLNAIDYYSAPAPKSLGREWVESLIIPILENSSISTYDKLQTFCIHVADQIAYSLANLELDSSILVTGGGAKNVFLIECLRKKGINIEIPSNEIVEYKEALIFAFLGLLRMLNIPNTLSSVTGAIKDSTGGNVYHP